MKIQMKPQFKARGKGNNHLKHTLPSQVTPEFLALTAAVSHFKPPDFGIEVFLSV